MLSFNFLGRSSLEFGIIVKNRPPIPMPERKVSYEDIPGRNGSLTYDEGTYKDITIAVECAVADENIPYLAEKIKAWLMGSQGELIFSDDIYKAYTAQVVNKFDIVPSINIFGDFIIIFNCKPFMKSLNDFNLFKVCEVNATRNSSVLNSLETYNFTTGQIIEANKTIEINTVKEFTIVNSGTIESRPKIKIMGTGDITLTINGRSFSILSLNGEITIDSELMDAYNETELLNNKMLGEFPYFDVGENLISYTGSLTSIEITPNTQFI